MTGAPAGGRARAVLAAATALLVVTSVLAPAGVAVGTAAADGPEPAATTITSCGFTASTPGVYELGNNVTASSGPCIAVNASNVVVDGQGYTITGDSNSNVVDVDGSSTLQNVTVRNAAVTGGFRGITATDVEGFRAANVTVAGSSRGVGLFGVVGGVVADSRVLDGGSAGGDGIVVNSGSSGVGIENVTVARAAENGITVRGSDVRINDSRIESNGDLGNLGLGTGIDIDGASGVYVTNNDVLNNSVGVATDGGASDVVVRDNRIGVQREGISHFDATNSTVADNNFTRATVTDNPYGMYSGVANATIEDNEFHDLDTAVYTYAATSPPSDEFEFRANYVEDVDRGIVVNKDGTTVADNEFVDVGFPADVNGNDNLVKNNTFRRSTPAVTADGSFEFVNGTRIVDNDVEDGTSFGIQLVDTNRSVVRNNTVRGVDRDGIQLRGASGTDVVGNDVFDVGDNGIEVQESEEVLIEGPATVARSGDRGIDLQDVNDSIVRDLTTTNNSDDGIELDESGATPFGSVTNVTVDNVTATENFVGVDVSIRLVEVRDTNASNNDRYGVFTDRDDVTVRNATVRGSDRFAGISISFAEGSTVVDSNVSNNAEDGVIVNGGTGNTVANVVARDNGGWDVRVTNNASGTDVGGLDLGASTAPNTTVDFGGKNVKLRGVSSPPAAPTGQTGIGRYVEAESTLANSYLNVAFQYDDADLGGGSESGLSVWEYDGNWSELGGTVDTAANVVAYNVTNVSTVFAPLANTTLFDQQWTAATDGRTQYSTPAVGSDRVFVGGLDDTLYALNRTGGSVDWLFNRSGSLVDSSPTLANGLVYVGSGGGVLYGLDAATGTVTWNYTTDSAIVSSPAAAGGTVYVGSNDGTVLAVGAAGGSEVWTTDLGSAVYSQPAVDGDTVYVTTTGGSLVALNATDGSQRWSRTVGSGLGHASPAVSGSTVYVAGDQLYAFDAGGTQQWTAPTGGTAGSTPAVDSGSVYVGSANGSVLAVEAASGSFQWAAATGGPVGSSPAVVGGNVVVGSDNGTLHAFDAGTGAAVGVAVLGSPVRSSPAVADGVAYVGSRSGTVYALANPGAGTASTAPPTADSGAGSGDGSTAAGSDDAADADGDAGTADGDTEDAGRSDRRDRREDRIDRRDRMGNATAGSGSGDGGDDGGRSDRSRATVGWSPTAPGGGPGAARAAEP